MISVLRSAVGMRSEKLYTHCPVLKVIFLLYSSINEQQNPRHQGSLISLAISFHATATPVICDEPYAVSQYESRFATCTVSFLVLRDVS